MWGGLFCLFFCVCLFSLVGGFFCEGGSFLVGEKAKFNNNFVLLKILVSLYLLDTLCSRAVQP